MKNKERQELVKKLDELRKVIDANEFLKTKYPNLESRVDEVYQGILYDKVDDKANLGNEDDHKGNRKLKQLEVYCDIIKNFVDDMQKLPSGAKTSFLPLKTILENKEKVKGQIKAEDRAFVDGINAMHAYIDSISTDLTIEEIMAGLAKAVKDAYVDVKFDAIKATTSYRAVRQLGIPVIDNFVDNRRDYAKGLTPPFDAATLRSGIEGIFDTLYMMSEDEFSADVNAWVKEMQSKVNDVVTHTYEKCAIDPAILAKTIGGKIAAGNHPLYKKIQAATESAITKANKGKVAIWGEYAKELINTLDGINSIFATIQELEGANAPDFFSKQLNNINIEAAFTNAVDRNSPYYIVGQPNFEDKFEERISTWKQEMKVALDNASGILLSMEGVTIDGTIFKDEILKTFKKEVDAIKAPIDKLNLPVLKLREHKDLGEFQTKWGTPWGSAVENIDTKSILESDDVELKADLFKNRYDYLPLKEEVNTALLKSVTDKLYLALEQSRKNEINIQINRKNINEVKTEVNIVKNEVTEIKNEVTEIKNDIKVIKKDVKELHVKVEQNYELIQKNNIEIKKTQLGDVNIDVDVDIDVNIELNSITKNLLKQFDKEWSKEIVIFDTPELKFVLGSIGIADVELSFSAKAVAGIKASAKASELKAELTGYANVTGTMELSAAVGLDLYFWEVNLIELILGAQIKAEGIINGQIFVTKGPGISAAVKAGFTITAGAYFKVKIANGWYEHTIDLGSITLLNASSPQYSLTFGVNPFRFFDAKKTKGKFEFVLNPSYKDSVEKAKNRVDEDDKQRANAKK